MSLRLTIQSAGFVELGSVRHTWIVLAASPPLMVKSAYCTAVVVVVSAIVLQSVPLGGLSVV
jgi:hypothetical protein